LPCLIFLFPFILLSFFLLPRAFFIVPFFCFVLIFYSYSLFSSHATCTFHFPCLSCCSIYKANPDVFLSGPNFL
jgi:hypothetical protein